MNSLANKLGMIALPILVTCSAAACDTEEDADISESNFDVPQEDEFLQAEQECVAIKSLIANQWCRQYVGEDTIAYFCAREPPETLQATVLDGRPNYYCGCDPGQGWEACPYNVNRDR